MARLIDADTAKEYLKRAIFGADQKIDAWVDAMPTVDAVPAVRCRDCKRCWHNVGTKESGVLCYKCPPGREDEYYCADGERRDDEKG